MFSGLSYGASHQNDNISGVSVPTISSKSMKVAESDNVNKYGQLRSHNNKPVTDHYNYLDLLNKMAHRLMKYDQWYL